MNYILFDDDSRDNLLPLVFTRPVSFIRIGILTIHEKWENDLKTKCSSLTQEYLSVKFPSKIEADNIFINGCVLPDAKLIAAINQLKSGECITKENKVIAFRGEGVKGSVATHVKNLKQNNYTDNIFSIDYCWDIFSKNQSAMMDDFQRLTKGRKSQKISSTNQVIAPENIFIEEGAIVECTIINASQGPVYIAAHAEVMEGALIRGPFSLGEHSQLKMGSKIYGATTVGPHCKVGGEVGNSVIFGYSNKGHEGYMGNSVIGEWCNWGADSNNSNLKNNYSQIKTWNYMQNDYINTNLQFCGLMMGDHSKCSINTMFNTGTIVGVNANIFGTGFPPKFIPGFSWGGSEGFKTYRLEDSFEVAQRVYERRLMKFDDTEKNIMQHLFELETKNRTW